MQSYLYEIVKSDQNLYELKENILLYKKRNPVYQIPARTEEHAVLNKMVTPARATQTSEEKYVKVGTTCSIHITLVLNYVESLVL